MDCGEDIEYLSETIRYLMSRASVREFSPKEIANDTVSAVLNAARCAPTSSNLQAYSLVVVRDPETRRRLSGIAGNQKHIEEAPVFVAICADLNRLARICERSGKSIDADGMELCLVAVIDAALVGMCASLASDSLGLGTVMIGGMRNDPKAAAEILGLPAGVFVPFGLCIGWPRRVPPPKPRLEQDAVIHWERYAAGPLDAALHAYDAALSDHQHRTGLSISEWSDRVAKTLSVRHRPHLSEALRSLGFHFR